MSSRTLLCLLAGLQDATKHFMVVSTDAPAPAVPAVTGGAGTTSGAAAPKGGVVSETITLTDTGERKQMFGLEARHIKTAIVRQPGDNALKTGKLRPAGAKS